MPASFPRALRPPGSTARATLCPPYPSRDEGSGFASGPIPAVPRLVEAAEAIQELLGRAPRRLVQLGSVIQELKLRPELAVQGVGVVANHVEPAARLRPLRTKGGHDHVAARFHRVGDLANVDLPLSLVRKEVEDGPIMPDVIAGGRQLDLGDVAGDPAHQSGRWTEPGLGDIDGGL